MIILCKNVAHMLGLVYLLSVYQVAFILLGVVIFALFCTNMLPDSAAPSPNILRVICQKKREKYNKQIKILTLIFGIYKTLLLDSFWPQ